MGRRRESFFSLPALILMGALIALALYLLFPRQSVFENPGYLEKPDALSIAYLEVLLRSDSDNEALRLSLARALGATSQPSRASEVLAPLLEQQPISEEALELHLELLAERLFAAPEGPDREALKDQLFISAQKLVRQPFEPTRILELITPMADWMSQPRYLSLLQSTEDRLTSPQQQLQLAREIARLQEAEARPGAAADTLRPHLETVDPANRVDYINNLIRLELASGNPEAALALFKQVWPVRNLSEDALATGIRLARLAGSATDEAAWVQQRADNNPGNVEYQRELLAFQLAAGNTADALNTVRRLQSAPGKLNRQDRQTIAQVLEWNNRPEQALPVWVALYRETGSSQAFQRAIDLARGLFQWDTLLELLSAGAEQERLQPDGYITLADALIRGGQFNQARARLEEGRIAYPRSEALQERLLALLINLRDYPATIGLLEKQPAISDADRLQLASLYWRTREPERALAVLDFEPADPQLADSVQAMRLQLATTLGRTDLLRQDYDRLLARDESDLTPALQETLLNLAVLFEDYPRALQLSQNRYQETGDPSYLASVAEYQLALEQWQELETTLDRWQDQVPDARQNPRYWSLLGLIQQRNGQVGAADDAYRTAWELAPDDESLMISWAWLKLANADRYADSLQALLARLGDNPSPLALPVLAYGHSALGQQRQALHWFREGLSSKSDDPQWLLATANLMEQTGSPGTAANLREQAAALLSEQQPTPPSRPEIAGQYNDPENRSQLADRYLRQIEQINRPMVAEQSQQLTRDTVNIHQTMNRAVQMGARWQNLGNFTVQRTGVTGQFAHDEFRWRVSASNVKADGAGRLNDTPDHGSEATLTLDRRDGNSIWSLSASHLPRYETDDLALAASYNRQWTDRIGLGAGYDFQERTTDSAEAWWLTRRNRAYLNTSYTPFSRLNLNAQVEQLTINSLENDRLADGYGLDLNATYTIFRNDPAWTVSAGYRNQQLSLEDELPAATLEALDQPLATSGLLTDEYERIGVSTRWFHGEPHALYRTTPSPRAFLGLDAGYVLSTLTAEVGVELGLGWRILGDDELALSGRRSSEGLDGEGRTEFNLTYTIYLGR